MTKNTTRIAALTVAALFFALAVSSIAAREEEVANRKLLQLQQPWLRLPAYESINPFRVVAYLTRQLTDTVSYGFLGDYVGDFFDSSFDLLRDSISTVGNSLGFQDNVPN